MRLAAAAVAWLLIVAGVAVAVAPPIMPTDNHYPACVTVYHP